MLQLDEIESLGRHTMTGPLYNINVFIIFTVANDYLYQHTRTRI